MHHAALFAKSRGKAPLPMLGELGDTLGEIGRLRGLIGKRQRKLGFWFIADGPILPQWRKGRSV